MNRTSTRFYLLVCSAVMLVAVMSACSTKKNTWTRRVYHNLTAHYNVYWNGMDNMRTGTKEFRDNVKDNYVMILPVYNFGDKASSGKMGQYAETALKKATKTIQKHSMVFNGREYNRWIDDAYMLMAKAYFYKQDYPMARRTFEFVIKTYNDNEVKYEAMIWYALASMQLNDFNRAESMLDMVAGKIREGKAPEKYALRTNLAYANFFILQKNYTTAVPYLTKSVDLGPDRYTKTRCYFILAQIRQQAGEYAAASSLYETVIKRNASFDMEFNAKINLAQCYETRSGNRENIVRKLNRMVKDEKNKDYLDQVYYALAGVFLKEKDTSATTKYLAKSVAASRGNNYQKAISSLLLADIYFESKEYMLSQAYYDSTMQFLPKDYPNYKEIKVKTATLTDLVENLNIIQREDSLQKLAAMPEGARNQVVDKIISKIIEEEVRQQQEEQQRLESQFLLTQSQPGSPGGMPTGGGWYFYNPTAMSQGYSTFIRKWGRRKQEDNWFLSDKSLAAFSTEKPPDTAMSADTSGGKKGGGKALTKKDREYYLKDIPLTEEMMDASNNKLIQAYYNAGFIYIEGLRDYGHSIETFETLLERFPGNKYSIASCYELYMLYKDLENKVKSDEYRDLILTQYSETDFAKLIINPEYYKEVLEKQKEAGRLYEDTYKAFMNQQYYIVILNYDEAKVKCPKDSVLMPRFEYLRALAIGKIEVEDSLVSALQKMVQRYPKSEIKPLAQNILDYIARKKSAPGQGEPVLNADSLQLLLSAQKLYLFNPETIHFFVLIVDNAKTDVDALKIKISDFNQRYHDMENLQVNSLLLDNNLEMLTVSTFENSQKALLYFTSINESKYIFTRLETTGGYSVFVISAENYPVFFRNKNIPQYQKFFESNYLVKK